MADSQSNIVGFNRRATDGQSEILDLYEELEYAKELKKQSEAKIKAIQEILFARIPLGETVQGIEHSEKPWSNVAYKMVLEEVIETFVPKTKRGEIPRIIASYTQSGTSPVFKKKEIPKWTPPS